MRRAAQLLLFAFAFAIPWEYSLVFAAPFGNIARVAGLAVLLAIVPAVLQKGRFRAPGPLQLLVLALYLWLCCSSFWAIEPQETLIRLRGYFQEMMIVWLVWELAGTPADFLNLLRAYVAGCWVLAALTMANFMSSAASLANGQFRFVPEGQDPNDVAHFLALGLPLAALLADGESRRLPRLLAWVYLPAGFVAILLTASRGGFVAAFVALAGCGLLLIRRHSRAVWAGALAMPIVAAALWIALPHQTLERVATIPQQLQGGDLNQRWSIWEAGWHAFERSPFLGSGAGSFVSAAGLAPEDTAHNAALAILVEGGIVALILASLILAAAAASVLYTRGAVRIAMGTEMLVWLVTSLVASVQQDRTTWLLLALIALAGRLAAESKESLDLRCTRSGLLPAAVEP